jgi:hypothetical protein
MNLCGDISAGLRLKADENYALDIMHILAKTEKH